MGNTASQIKEKVLRNPLQQRPQTMHGRREAISSFTEKQHELAIRGLARTNCNKTLPTCLVDLVMQYSLCRIYSNILNSGEERNLCRLLLDTIKKQEGNFNLGRLRYRLIFRASEHGFSADQFHKYCDKKGPNMVIIRNDHDHVYGGYSFASWNKKLQTVTDPKTFVWCVRPRVEAFGFRESENDGEQAMWNYPGYGPLYGRGNDVWVTDKCDDDGKQSGYGSGQSFACKGKAFGATDRMLNGYEQCYCNVVEYEVFSVELRYDSS